MCDGVERFIFFTSSVDSQFQRDGFAKLDRSQHHDGQEYDWICITSMEHSQRQGTQIVYRFNTKRSTTIHLKMFSYLFESLSNRFRQPSIEKAAQSVHEELFEEYAISVEGVRYVLFDINAWIDKRIGWNKDKIKEAHQLFSDPHFHYASYENLTPSSGAKNLEGFRKKNESASTVRLLRLKQYFPSS